jgi:hypothetical protein
MVLWSLNLIPPPIGGGTLLLFVDVQPYLLVKPLIAL